MSKLKSLVYDIRYRTIFISVFVIGLFVHGSRFFTVYLFHDDLSINGAGATFTSGRWFLQYLYDLVVKLIGSHINTKGFIAIVSFVFLAVICCIIARDLMLKSKKSLILLSAIVVTFPYVTSLFGFTFTATYYCLANLMVIVAASLIQRILPMRQFWWRLVVSVVLLCLSIATYQGTLCVFMAYLMILAIKNSLLMEEESWKHFILRCCSYLVVCGAGYALYTLCNKTILALKGLQMNTYQGLNEMGSFTIPQMLHRFVFAYKQFFFPALGKEYSYYSTVTIRTCYLLVLLSIVVLCLIFLVKAIQEKSWSKAIQLLLLFLLTPAAINSIFLIVDMQTATIHALMMLGSVFTLIFPLFALELLGWGRNLSRKTWLQLAKYGCCAVCLFLVYSSAYFAYQANACYTKAAIQQQQSISYFTRLVTRIQSVEGYSTSLPVAFVAPREKNNEQLSLWYFTSVTNVRPYQFSSIINDYKWISFMRMWCGYDPETVSQEVLDQISSTDQVQEMPCYPDDGSIQIVDDVIVVKFAD